MSELMNCEICGAEVQGTPFTVVALSTPPRPVEVCAVCAQGPYVSVNLDGTPVTVDRDDYLCSDPEDLLMAVQAAVVAAEDHGWQIEGLTLSAL